MQVMRTVPAALGICVSSPGSIPGVAPGPLCARRGKRTRGRPPSFRSALLRFAIVSPRRDPGGVILPRPPGGRFTAGPC